jgi:hypothetical protein
MGYQTYTIADTDIVYGPSLSTIRLGTPAQLVSIYASLTEAPGENVFVRQGLIDLVRTPPNTDLQYGVQLGFATWYGYGVMQNIFVYNAAPNETWNIRLWPDANLVGRQIALGVFVQNAFWAN